MGTPITTPCASCPTAGPACDSCERRGTVTAEFHTPSAPLAGYTGEELQRGDYLHRPERPHVKDSGERRSFDTGAQRDRAAGKGRFDLLPVTAIFALAKQLEAGAAKYESRNWEKGMPCSVFLDSAIRHLFKFLGGLRDEDHLAAALFNVAGLQWTLQAIKEGRLPENLNDLPKACLRAKDFPNG
mgnify:CR=1 FL=1